MESPIIIYSSINCGYCEMAKKLLDEKKINYQEINLYEETYKREEMLNKSNGKRTVPQIFYGNIHIGGYEDLKMLELSGKLEKMING